MTIRIRHKCLGWGKKKKEVVKFCALVYTAIREGQILPSHVLEAW